MVAQSMKMPAIASMPRDSGGITLKMAQGRTATMPGNPIVPVFAWTAHFGRRTAFHCRPRSLTERLILPQWPPAGSLVQPFVRIAEKTEEFSGGHIQANYQRSLSSASSLEVGFYYDGYRRDFTIVEVENLSWLLLG
jgi:hypothetical protein